MPSPGTPTQGAQVRHGDFDDPATLADAFAGGRRLLLISTDAVGARVPQHDGRSPWRSLAGVEFVAYTSIVNPTDANPAGVVPDHKATEEALRGSGLDWALLRHSIYADFEADNLAAAAATGKLVTNAGAGRLAYVAHADSAPADAAVLVGGDHAGKVYDITGPEALDADARAAVFADLAGSPVEVVHVDDESFAAGLAQATGMPMEFARLYTSFGRPPRGPSANVSTRCRPSPVAPVACTVSSKPATMVPPPTGKRHHEHLTGGAPTRPSLDGRDVGPGLRCRPGRCVPDRRFGRGVHERPYRELDPPGLQRLDVLRRQVDGGQDYCR